jgi:death on curing protein
VKVTLYPTLAETLELHSRLIDRFGGASGVRDLGLLESALHRPRTGYYATLSLEAAALLESLTQNHAFVDGNKRIAFATTAIFLRMNGYRLKVDADNGESFLIDQVITKRVSIEVISAWLEKHMVKVKS